MSRVQNVYIPDVESFEPYVRSLCHMARILDQNGTNYNKMKHVVVIGTSKRMAEAYVRQLLGSKDLPSNLICFGCDESPVNHREFSYIGSHVVLLPELNYASESALDKISRRVIEMILSLKQKDEDTELKNGALTVTYQNPRIWSCLISCGAVMNSPNYANIQFQKDLVSSIGVGQLMTCNTNEDYHELHAQTITIGLEFLYVKTEYLIEKLHNMLWSLGSTESKFKDKYTIVLHEDFRLALFEQYLLYDFRGF